MALPLSLTSKRVNFYRLPITLLETRFILNFGLSVGGQMAQLKLKLLTCLYTLILMTTSETLTLKDNFLTTSNSYLQV